MAKVQDIALYVRSKGAGPFWVTIEVFFDNDEAYETFKNSQKVTKGTIAKLYGVEEALVKEFYIDNIRVGKFSFPRRHPAGWEYENDMHSGQQYIRLAEAEV
ncbi:DUF4387 domain-containing protein [Eubacteriales bacterium OttesenSCG-928-K08]|nr:DUF4387 domain-containing protein [Eubacteriales bacterium OttesenSCG-928-K08]